MARRVLGRSVEVPIHRQTELRPKVAIRNPIVRNSGSTRLTFLEGCCCPKSSKLCQKILGTACKTRVWAPLDCRLTTERKLHLRWRAEPTYFGGVKSKSFGLAGLSDYDATVWVKNCDLYPRSSHGHRKNCLTHEVRAELHPTTPAQY